MPLDSLILTDSNAFPGTVDVPAVFVNVGVRGSFSFSFPFPFPLYSTLDAGDKDGIKVLVDSFSLKVCYFASSVYCNLS